MSLIVISPHTSPNQGGDHFQYRRLHSYSVRAGSSAHPTLGGDNRSHPMPAQTCMNIF